MTGPTPSPLRVRAIHDVAPNTDGQYVLYWMIAARRSSWNFALDRAVDWARALGKPLIVFEALRCDYRWASDRLHRFVLEGMVDNATAFEAMGIGYYPYIEPTPRAGRGLLAALATRAAVVITDRAPVFDLPRWVASAARDVRVRFEEVDGNGLLPLDAPPPGCVFATAYAFRRFLQRRLPEFLTMRPRGRSTGRADLPPPADVEAPIVQRWPRADLTRAGDDLSALPIDHAVPAVAQYRGGAVAAHARVTTFLKTHLATYADQRNHPDDDHSSGLSPYLHFGHVSSHEIADRILRHDGWTIDRVAHTVSGTKEGWWGASAGVEAFLDQLVTWRELGFNMADRRPDHDRFESLPPWAVATLQAHAADRRPSVYSLDQFARAETADALWNAAQRQLRTEGRIHNYLRMLWGKKILEWTASPRDALAVMIELNNRYALDGRDPNSYSGIFWVLGRYDRPWPERPVYGAVRCMTSGSTAKKLRVKSYLRRFGAPHGDPTRR